MTYGLVLIDKEIAEDILHTTAVTKLQGVEVCKQIETNWSSNTAQVKVSRMEINAVCNII